MRQLEEQRHVSTAAAIEKSGMADTMVSQKSGPALAGPAAPATTALTDRDQNRVAFFCVILNYSTNFFFFFFFFFVCVCVCCLKKKKKKKKKKCFNIQAG